MRPFLQIGIITASCVAIYAAMRSLPVEPCSFLHYGDYVNAEGAIEGCGYEETTFFNLNELRYPILVELTSQQKPLVGQPTQFDLSIFTTSGRPISYEEIVISHTEKVHLMAVNSTLDDYQHIHPKSTGVPGHFTFEMTPQHEGEYRVYLDFIPQLNNRRTLLQTRFTTSHQPPATSHQPPASSLQPPATSNQPPATSPQQPATSPQPPATSNQPPATSHHFTLQNADQLRTGKEHQITLRLNDPEGLKPRFVPVMGAFAHLVAFDEQGLGFAHLHPRNPDIHNQDPHNPDLTFVIQLDTPGNYRIWAQVNLEGQELFIPFDLKAI